MVFKSVDNIKRIDEIEKDEEDGALCKDRRATNANFLPKPFPVALEA